MKNIKLKSDISSLKGVGEKKEQQPAETEQQTVPTNE